MAIVKAIGFDDGTTDMGQFFTQGGWDGVPISTTNPRTGGYCVSLGGGNTQNWRTNFPGSYTTGWVYFAFRVSTLPASGDAMYRFHLMDNGTSQVYLAVASTGRLNLYRGDGTLLANGTSTVVSAGAWVQCAWRYVIDNAAGVCQVRWNGQTTNDIDVTLDTQNTASAVVNQFQFTTSSSPNQALQVDDIVIQDATGSAPENDWLGDVECRYVWPNATDGASSGFTPGGTSPAPTRHQSVNNIPTDEVTTTIDAVTVGEQAVFATEGVPVTSGDIYAVIPSPRALKTAGGLRTIATAIMSGATVVSGDDIALTSSFQTHQDGQVFHRAADGTPWTAAGFNAHLFKVILTT